MKTVEKIMDFVDIDSMFEDAKGKYKTAIIIGYGNDGHLKVNTTGAIRSDETLWMVEQYKVGLLAGEYSDD